MIGLDLDARAALVAGATAERARRETHYPGMIEAGHMERGDAQADIDAWRAIEAMLALEPIEDGGRNPRIAIGTELPWEALERAANRAVISLTERVSAHPDNPKLRQRLNVVQTIQRWIGRERRFWAPGSVAV